MSCFALCCSITNLKAILIAVSTSLLNEYPNLMILFWSLSDKGDPDDLYQDWQQEYEEWRDVHMNEWNEEFDKYKENSGCDEP